MPDVERIDEYIVYNLGEPIVLSKIVKTENICNSSRKLAMLDTLLTDDTIYEGMWDFMVKNKRRIRSLTCNLREERLKNSQIK